jgi:hypothetical protein
MVSSRLVINNHKNSRNHRFSISSPKISFGLTIKNIRIYLSIDLISKQHLQAGILLKEEKQDMIHPPRSWKQMLRHWKVRDDVLAVASKN